MNEDRKQGQGQQADHQKRDQQQGGGLGQEKPGKDHKQHQQSGDHNQQQGGSNDRSDIKRDIGQGGLGKDDLGQKGGQAIDRDQDRL